MRVQLGTRRAMRLVRRLGYPAVRTLKWDHGMTPPPVTGRHASLRSRLIQHLPQRALVTATRSQDSRTLLDDIVSEASSATGLGLKGRPSVRAELLIIDTDHGVLRAAMGPGSRQIVSQRAAIAALAGCDPPPVVAERVPAEIAAGHRGGAEWSLERRLAGARPQPPLSAGVLSDCLDFLVALHCACPSDAVDGAFVEQAEMVAGACGPDGASLVHAVAERLEDVLSDMPRGFAHGDFFHGNLLADGGRLVGVIDWEAAGPGRLPFLDLFHLHLLSLDKEVADLDWGPLLARRLLPWARAGGGVTVHEYSRRRQLTVSRTELEALAVAYWLDYASYQLRVHKYRRAQRRWIERSIHLVLRSLRADRALR